jgi:hypothetical protein
MMPNNTKHAPTKGNERPLPVIAIDNIVVANPIPPTGLLGNSEETKNGLHVARSNARSINDGDDSKRKAGLHAGSERTTKRANKQDHPGMSYTKDNPSNNEDRKPAAKESPPNPPTPDGALSMFPGLKVESTSTHTHTGSVVSTSGQGIKLEQPAPKTETASNLKCEPRTPTDQAETSIPAETVMAINGPNLNRTVAVRRKAAKRSEPWYLALPPQNIAAPLLPSPKVEDIPARKTPRLEDSLPATTDEASRKTASPDISVGLPPPAADNDDDANADLVTDTQPLCMNLTSNSSNTYQNNPLQQNLLPNVPGGMPGMMPQGNFTPQQQQAMRQQQIQQMMQMQQMRRMQMQQMHTMQMQQMHTIQMQQQQRGQQQPPTPQQQPPMQQGGATARWTPEEDAKLTDAVSNTCKKKHGKKLKIDWVAVASLVPGRTRKQCLDRWCAALDPTIALTAGSTGKWTEDEDLKLRAAVQTHGGKNWYAIALMVPGRTKNQCYSRWYDALDPSIALTAGRTGTWSADEVIKLKAAVQTHGGKNWNAIAAMVPGRTKSQCHNRWHNFLDPSITLTARKTGTWTADENKKLRDAVQTHGDKDWAGIAALVPGRTSKQCRDRWLKYMDSNRITVRGK